MLNNPIINITLDDIRTYNGEEFKQFMPFIKFNLDVQKFRNPSMKLLSDEQFSKGYQRLKIWLDLAYKIPPIYTDFYTNEKHTIRALDIPYSEAKIYALACLMVILQVFGDGNHRTANEYFKSYTGKSLTEEQLNMTGYDFSKIVSNRNPASIINEIVGKLTSKYQGVQISKKSKTYRKGGRKQIKKFKRKTNKSKRKTNKLKRKYKP